MNNNKKISQFVLCYQLLMRKGFNFTLGVVLRQSHMVIKRFLILRIAFWHENPNFILTNLFPALCSLYLCGMKTNLPVWRDIGTGDRYIHLTNPVTRIKFLKSLP